MSDNDMAPIAEVTGSIPHGWVEWGTDDVFKADKVRSTLEDADVNYNLARRLMHDGTSMWIFTVSGSDMVQAIAEARIFA